MTDLRHMADKYGGIPLFCVLIVYFSKQEKTFINVSLLIVCIIALLIDIYLSYIYVG